jgi:hypothetical protein
MDITALVTAVQALVTQVADLQRQVEALSVPPVDKFTQEEMDLVLAKVEDLKVQLQTLVAPAV